MADAAGSARPWGPGEAFSFKIAEAFGLACFGEVHVFQRDRITRNQGQVAGIRLR